MKFSHLLMCWKHWDKLPNNIKQAVYSGHRAMQEGTESRSWLIARERARLFVAVKDCLNDDVVEDIELEIARLEAVRL